MGELISQFSEWIKGVIEQVVQFLLDTVISFFDWLWTGFLQMLDSLGIAEAVRNASSMFSFIPETVWYFANMAQISYGIGAVLGAFAIRFLIRRIPFFG